MSARVIVITIADETVSVGFTDENKRVQLDIRDDPTDLPTQEFELWEVLADALDAIHDYQADDDGHTVVSVAQAERQRIAVQQFESNTATLTGDQIGAGS